MEIRSADALEVVERVDIVEPGTVDVPIRDRARLKVEQGQVEVGGHCHLCHRSP